MHTHQKHKIILKLEKQIIKIYKNKKIPIQEICIKYDISRFILYKIVKKYKIKHRGVLKKWSNKQINWIKRNYYKFGPKRCADKLGIKRSQISKIASTYNLKMDKEIRREFLRNDCINNKKYYPIMKEFDNITKPEIAYFLGYFWADGHLFKKTNSVKIVIEKEDAKNVKNVFMKCGNWGIYSTENQKEGKNNIAFEFTDYKLHTFLKNNDYLIKSGASANKILSQIPERLKHYWWRGYFDGDGGLSTSSLAITSVYEQNWNFYKKLCKKLKIRFKTRKAIKDNRDKYSHVYFCKILDIIRFFNYIYKNYTKDNIGLKRKYNQYINYLSNRTLEMKYYYKYTKTEKEYVHNEIIKYR